MCAFDWINTEEPSTDPIVEHFQARFSKVEEHLLSSPRKSDHTGRVSSCESLYYLPTYEKCTEAPTPQSKCTFLRRIFSRNHKKDVVPKQELPSYRETELENAWAKVGIDINDHKQGPRPHSTPEEWLAAMDGLFGAPTMRISVHDRASTPHSIPKPRRA